MKPTRNLAFAMLFGVSALAAVASLRANQTAAPPAPAAKPYVVPDLAERVAKFKQVKIVYRATSLTSNERKMVVKLVDAAGLLDDAYWRQSDPDGLQLYVSLASSKDPQDMLLRRYLRINGDRFDLIDDNRPFVGTQPMPPGRGFFPQDLTKQE